MKRIVALLLLLAMTLSLFSGCAQEEEEAYVPTGSALLMEGDDPEDYLAEEPEPQVFSLAYDSGRSMNPLIGHSQNNRVLFSMMYQGLFAVSSNYEAVPILCSAFQVAPSNMIYTCYVEPDARFSDGSPVTAQDVYSSLHYAKGCRYYKGRFLHVLDIVLTVL